MRQHSDELSSSSPYSSLEESNGYGSFPGGTVMYPSDPRIGTTFVVQSPMSNLPLLKMGGNTLSNPTIQTGVGQTGQSSFYQGPSSLEGYSAPSSVTYQGYNETPYHYSCHHRGPMMAGVSAEWTVFLNQVYTYMYYDKLPVFILHVYHSIL